MEIWGTVISFAIILVVTNRTNNLWGALLLGSLALGIISGQGVLGIGAITWIALTTPLTIQLTLIIILIGVLGKIMKDVGLLDRMVASLSILVTNVRWILMLIPSLLGLIAVPGGAALSAPLIDRAGEEMGLDSHDKAAVNLFFRHILHLIFPLFPALLIAESVSGISVYRFIVIQAAPTLAAVAVGYWVLLGRRKEASCRELARAEVCTGEDTDAIAGEPGGAMAVGGRKAAAGEFFFSMLPVLVVLVLGIGFRLSFLWALTVGVAIALSGNIVREVRETAGSSWPAVYRQRAVKLVWPGINWNMGLVTVAVMIFQQFVKETGAVNALVEVMANWGLPLFWLAVVISFIIGFVTGNNIASTATAFILFSPMLPAETALVYLSLIFMIGMVGYLLSPLHLCLLVTNEYYQTNPFKLLAKTSVPVMALILGTIGLYWFLI